MSARGRRGWCLPPNPRARACSLARALPRNRTAVLLYRSVVNQVFFVICFDAFEMWVLRRWPTTRWLCAVRPNHAGRLVKVPSRLLMLLLRSATVGLETLVAISLPFFTSICGLVRLAAAAGGPAAASAHAAPARARRHARPPQQRCPQPTSVHTCLPAPLQVAALGYAPGMMLLPVVLYLGARRGRLSAAQLAGLWAFLAFFAAACVVSGTGALWYIIVSASTWDFFS